MVIYVMVSGYSVKDTRILVILENRQKFVKFHLTILFQYLHLTRLNLLSLLSFGLTVTIF